MSEFITMGEPMVVLIPQQTGTFAEVETFRKGLAGAELNVAVGVTRLGHSVSYISALGDDVFGDYLRESIEKEGIDTSLIKTDADHLTGAYFKTKVLSGDPSVHYMRKNSAASAMNAADMEQIDFSGRGIFHCTGITAGVSLSCREASRCAMEKARAAGRLVTFDPNIRRQLWKSEDQMIEVLNDLAFHSDIVMPGISEGKLLTGAADIEGVADFYLSHGTKTVIIKDGANGAYCKSAAGNNEETGANAAKFESFRVPGFKVEHIVDTVGAGDAFAAGVISGLLEGLELKEAIRRGNAMGAIMISFPGDNEGLPTRTFLDGFMKGEIRR